MAVVRSSAEDLNAQFRGLLGSPGTGTSPPAGPRPPPSFGFATSVDATQRFIQS